MTLHDRIMALECSTDGDAFHWGFLECKDEAAQLAAEVDELMAEMAEALESYALEDFGWAVAQSALEKYNAYKEQSNEQ